MHTLLIDGSHLARRNYHGQNLSTSSGVRTGMVYGFINSLLFLQRKVEANRVFVVWDTPGGSGFRKEMFKAYKANRSAVEPDYLEDLELLKTLLEALGVAQLSPQDGECDDAIGYLCGILAGTKYVFSGDKDFYQLLSDEVQLLNTEGEFIECDNQGRLELKENNKYILLRPDQITSYKALKGDTADNIPGVYRFGIVAATKYFAKNEYVDDFLAGEADLSELSAMHITNLLRAKPFLGLYKQLATIDPEHGYVKVPLVRPEVDWTKACKLFEYLEFKVYSRLGKDILLIGGDLEWV